MDGIRDEMAGITEKLMGQLLQNDKDTENEASLWPSRSPLLSRIKENILKSKKQQEEGKSYLNSQNKSKSNIIDELVANENEGNISLLDEEGSLSSFSLSSFCQECCSLINTSMELSSKITGLEKEMTAIKNKLMGQLLNGENGHHSHSGSLLLSRIRGNMTKF